MTAVAEQSTTASSRDRFRWDLYSKHTDKVIKLLRADPSLAEVPDDSDFPPPPQLAAKWGGLDVIKVMFELRPLSVFQVTQRHQVPAIVLAGRHSQRSTFDFLYACVSAVKFSGEEGSFGSALSLQAHQGHAALIEFYAGKHHGVQQTLDYYLDTYWEEDGIFDHTDMIEHLLMLGAKLQRYLSRHPWLPLERRENLENAMKVITEEMEGSDSEDQDFARDELASVLEDIPGPVAARKRQRLH